MTSSSRSLKFTSIKIGGTPENRTLHFSIKSRVPRHLGLHPKKSRSGHGAGAHGRRFRPAIPSAQPADCHVTHPDQLGTGPEDRTLLHLFVGQGQSPDCKPSITLLQEKIPHFSCKTLNLVVALGFEPSQYPHLGIIDFIRVAMHHTFRDRTGWRGRIRTCGGLVANRLTVDPLLPLGYSPILVSRE